MIRPYLRDLINDHKPTTEPNYEENDENEENDSDTEWKIHIFRKWTIRNFYG